MMRTDRRFTKLLLCDLVGDVRPHEDGHSDAQLLPDDLGDQLQALRTRIHTLEQTTGTHAQRSTCTSLTF